MGCTSGKPKAGGMVSYSKFKLIRSVQKISLDDFDISRPSERQVKEFPFYSTRLKEIDYQSIIADGNDWVDPHFPPNTNAIIDDDMMRNQRIRAWETLTWKRPKEVYKDKGIPFCIYENIGPNDIK